MKNLEMGTAIALTGAGVFQLHDIYVDHAGPLADVRNAAPHDPETMFRLQDSDVLTGAISLLVGGSISLATGKVYPLVLAIIGFVLVSTYYHSALTSASPIREAASNERD